MVTSIRPQNRSAPRGKTAAIVLLVLAAVCLIIGVAGGYFAMVGGQTIAKAANDLAAAESTTLVVPGETTVAGEKGAIIIAARMSETVDGKPYSFGQGTKVTVTVTDATGANVPVDSATQGQVNFPSQNGGLLSLVGFAKTSGPGNYTVKVTGDETAVRVRSFSGAEGEAVLGAIAKTGGGIFGGLCGCGGFVIFGIIGIILLIVGRKKTL